MSIVLYLIVYGTSVKNSNLTIVDGSIDYLKALAMCGFIIFSPNSFTQAILPSQISIWQKYIACLTLNFQETYFPLNGFERKTCVFLVYVTYNVFWITLQTPRPIRRMLWFTSVSIKLELNTGQWRWFRWVLNLLVQRSFNRWTLRVTEIEKD